MSIHQCIEDILDCGGINRMTEIALTPGSDDAWRKRVNFALALLANMTRTERGAVELCGYTMPAEAVPIVTVEDVPEEEQRAKLPSKPTMALLTALFLNKSFISDGKKSMDNKKDEKDDDDDDLVDEQTVEEVAASTDDPFQHFAAVLMNATQVEQGRRFVMRIHRQQDENIKGVSMLEKLLPELKSSNPIRRRGIAGMLKNCCFEKDASWWLIHEVDVIPKILYPLAGPEELSIDEKRGMDPDLWLEGPDKVREPDHVTRLLLVESILLLCASGRKSRENIRVQRTYVILKMMDLTEESEEISERINECVQYIRRDEEGTQEGSSDRLVDESVTINGKLLALPAPSPCENIGTLSHDDYDNVD
jgi:hypothetical protein